MHVLGSLAKPAVLGLVLGLAGAAGLGCTTDRVTFTELWPEGPPLFKQVFLYVHDADGNRLHSMAYGDHYEWPVLEDGTEDPAYPKSAENVIAYNGYGEQKIRVVFDELLKGATLEQFVCACAVDGYTAALPDPASYCDGGIITAIEASGCPDNPTTVWTEAGQFLDADFDGTADDAVLLPGIATITCGSVHTWTNGEQDGWWWNSGNQVVPLYIVGGMLVPYWEGLGPAIVLLYDILPTNTECVLSFDETIVDKQGIPIEEAFTFTTEPLTVWATASAPANGATDVGLDETVTLVFNTLLSDLPAGAITVSDGTADVAGTWVVSGDEAEFTPDAPLNVATTYTVNISTAVTDSFGIPLPAALTLSFTTEPLLVVATTPADGATDVAVDTTIEIGFNTPVVAPADSITVEDAAGTPVTGTITVDAATSTATFTPDATLATETDYTVTVTTAVTDLIGTALPADVTFTFTTAAP